MTAAPASGQRGLEWFEALFREHHGAILAYALRRVGPDADDVVADVFAVAWRRRDMVPDDPLPWLYRTAAHHVLHAHRKLARRGGLLRQLSATMPHAPAEDPVADDVTGRVDSAASIHRMLAALPAADAELLRLWAWEGLDAASIGYVVGCSAATVRVRLLRARRRARALLSQSPAPRRLEDPGASSPPEDAAASPTPTNPEGAR